MPIPDVGYHHLGVCYEDLTVLGAGSTSRTVESTDMSLIQVRTGMRRFWGGEEISSGSSLRNRKTPPDVEPSIVHHEAFEHQDGSNPCIAL
jgi:hypothetical protein